MTKDVEKLVGQEGFIMTKLSMSAKAEKVAVKVTVKDTKREFGKTYLLIEPVAGEGANWVSVDSVRFFDED